MVNATAQKHMDKPNCLLQWLTKEKVYLKSDSLGMGRQKQLDT